MSIVLDASALLAFLQDEPGAWAVEEVLEQSLMSTVNWSEVVQKTQSGGGDVQGMETDFVGVGLELVPFSTRQAALVADLWSHTRNQGLSLGVRACLALGLQQGAPVMTADRAWKALDLGLTIRTLR